MGAIDAPSFAVTGDGRYLATALVRRTGPGEGKSTLTVWDLQTGTRRFSDVDLTFVGTSLAINADASQLAVDGGLEGRVQLLDAATGRLQHELEPIPRSDDAVYFNYTVSLATPATAGSPSALNRGRSASSTPSPAMSCAASTVHRRRRRASSP